MSKNLGLLGYHSVQFYTKNLERCAQWHLEKFGFKPIAKSTPEWEKRNGMKALALCGAGKLGWILCQPLEPHSSAGRYLNRHPDGVAFLNSRVKDIQQTTAFLADRKAPFLYGIEKSKDNEQGQWHETAIASALDDVGFRFIEESNYEKFAPGFQWIDKQPLQKNNSFGLDFGIDHVTSNARSMHSVTEFYRQCLGFEPYWGIEFHTSKYRPDMTMGSGLESIVMWDPESGIKFATNQPLAPYFNNSQIQLFIEDNNGSGIQHIAFGTKNIIETVGQLREKQVSFLEASDRYYELLPGRMKEMEISSIKEPMDQVQKNNILLDGNQGKYLLQIFMKEQNIQLQDKQAGPFFYEIIQREGDESFGEGNFKALFDSIEKQQVIDARQEMRDRADSLI